MKYVVQIDLKISGVVTTDSTKVDGVIITRLINCQPSELIGVLSTEFLKSCRDFEGGAEIIELTAVAVEGFDDVKEGSIYY